MKDPESLFAAIEDVRNDSTETNWALFKYDDARRDAIELFMTGTDGLEGIKANFAENFTGYGYLRVLSGDAESRRTKFVFLRLAGARAPVMNRARMSQHTPYVEQIVKHLSISHTASNVAELNEDEIMLKVKRAGGADYDAGSNRTGYQSRGGEIKRSAFKALSSSPSPTSSGVRRTPSGTPSSPSPSGPRTSPSPPRTPSPSPDPTSSPVPSRTTTTTTTTTQPEEPTVEEVQQSTENLTLEPVQTEVVLEAVTEPTENPLPEPEPEKHEDHVEQPAPQEAEQPAQEENNQPVEQAPQTEEP